MGSPEAWAELRRLYLSDHQPALRDVWKSVKRIAAENDWPWCTYKSCWNQLSKRIPPQDQTRYRDPAKYRSALAPYIALDPESFKPGRLWIGDHKQLDLICMWRGQKLRPWLTTWMDWRTRKIVGYVLSDSPNSFTILAAFRHGILDTSNRGGPDEVWIDNGKDYAAWVFHGTTKQERRVDCRVNEAAAVGLFDGLQIKAHFAQPYNPNGKARLERWFGQLTGFARHFPTYTGISVDDKPESLAAVLKRRELIPTFEEVEQRVAAFIAGENEDAEHDIDDLAEHGERLAPADAFRRWVTSERRAVDPSSLDLFMAQWAKEVRVNRNGIAIAIRGVTIEYGQFDPLLAAHKAAKKADRRPLRVSFDPADLRTIKVYRDDWSFLCTAEMNGVGGRSANAITADHLAETLKQQRRYTRARQDVNDLAITQILTNTEQIAVAANPPPLPPAPPMSIRPVQTPLDGQSKAVERERLRKAAGAENQQHPDDAALSPFDLLQQYRTGQSGRQRGDDTPDFMAQLREKNRER